MVSVGISRFDIGVLKVVVVGIGEMAAKQMEEIQKKLERLSYARANAPAQSLLFAGMERYALLEWLFFKLLSLFFLSKPQPFYASASDQSIKLVHFGFWSN